MKKKNYYLRIFTALLLLANPNIHIIDILPDFIAYFLIFSVVSEAADLAPHFAQAKDACKRLALLCLFKIPASFIIVSLRSSNTQDMNLIPTFAIIFAVFEMILAYTLIFRISEGLFYLGERSDATALISPFRVRVSTDTEGGKEVSSKGISAARGYLPEALRGVSLVFIFVKCFSSFVPEMLLLTRKQEYVGDLSGQFALVRLYPYALIFAIGLTLAVGIYWLVLASAYLKAIKKEGKFLPALLSLAGEAVIAKKEKHELCSAFVLGFTLVAISSLFSLNFMPLFCFSLFLLLGSIWIKTERRLRVLIRIFGSLTTVLAIVLSIMLDAFDTDFGYPSLLNDNEAIATYRECVLVAAVCAVLFIVFLYLIYLSLRRSIFSSFGAPISEKAVGEENRYKKSLARMNIAFFILSSLCIIARAIYVYLQGQVIFIPSTAATIGTFSHQWEFWPLIMTVLCIPFIIFTFYYMGLLKEEAKLSLDEEE